MHRPALALHVELLRGARHLRAASHLMFHVVAIVPPEDPSSGAKLTSPNRAQNPALQNEAVWLTQLRLSRNMNIEKMNARTPPRPQGNVEGADATLLMGHGASAPSKRDVPLPWLKSLCHSLNQLPHPSDLIQTFPLPALNCAKRISSRQRNKRLQENSPSLFSLTLSALSCQVRASFHWRAKLPRILVSIVH